MYALPPIADMEGAFSNGRFMPEGGIANSFERPQASWLVGLSPT
jgi:hypothetical protein